MLPKTEAGPPLGSVHRQIDNHSRGGAPRAACCDYRPADGRRERVSNHPTSNCRGLGSGLFLSFTNPQRVPSPLLRRNREVEQLPSFRSLTVFHQSFQQHGVNVFEPDFAKLSEHFNRPSCAASDAKEPSDTKGQARCLIQTIRMPI